MLTNCSGEPPRRTPLPTLDATDSPRPDRSRRHGRSTGLDVAKEIARRQGVIDRWRAWSDVNDIHPTAPLGPDVLKALNALSLTAALWNHDVIAKDILMEMYCKDFSVLYDKIAHLHERVPGFERPPRAFLTPDINATHRDMHKCSLDGVSRTTLPTAEGKDESEQSRGE